MRTDDLIRALSADTTPQAPLSFRMTGLVALGCFVPLLVLVLLILGVRPDWATAITTPRVLFKFVMASASMGAGLHAAFQMMRPDCRMRTVLMPVTLMVTVLAAGVVAEMALTPEASWQARMLGHNAAFCLMIVPSLSILPLVGLLFATRDGASRNPVVSGAAVGLAASAIASFAYAFHCPDDSPLFVAVWYGLSMLLVSLIGSLLGARYLRW